MDEVVNRPGIFKLYKKKGAAAFALLPPKYDERGYMIKHGAVLLEVAPGIGKQQWDWDQKITFAISLADICLLVDRDPEKRRIFHEHNNKAKALNFQEGKGDWAGTFMMSLSEGKGENRKTFSVPLTNGEFQIIIRTLAQLVPLLLNWTENAMEAQVKRRRN